MDELTQKRMDSVLEDEIQLGYRIKTLPAPLQKELFTECGVAVSHVRFTRLNPSRRRKIAEVTQGQYQRDIQNPSILSHEQILKLVQERGEWSSAHDEELRSLQQTTSRVMGELYIDGLAETTWTDDLLDAAEIFRTKIQQGIADPEQRKAILTRFDRWVEYAPDKKDEYSARYAEDQGRPEYSVDVDLQRLVDVSPDMEAIERLHVIDDLRDKLQRYIKLQKDRLRLAELQVKHAKIFSESAEQRRDNTEEMARLYFTVERVDELGKPLGPLVPQFDAMYNFPERVIQWFLVEAYFFLNGIPDSTREYLEAFGFIAADAGVTTSANGESEPSDVSPAPQNSRLDSDPAAETVSVSSAALAVTS